MSAESDLIKMKALGRHFDLGTLYNYTDDDIISNLLLWDPRTVKRLTMDNTGREAKVTVHTLATDQVGNEESHLGIDDHSVMSLMAGLVTPPSGGAWHYIVDRANGTVGPLFGRGSEVAVHCRSSSRKISIDPTNQLLEIVCRTEGLSNNNASHVVVAVSYGLEALCIFSPHKQPGKWANLAGRDENVKKRMQGYASYFADNLSRGSSGLDDEHHFEATDFQTILYSDLIKTDRNGQSWTSQPVARQYEACRKVLDHQLSQAIPLEVWLYPIHNLREFKGASSIGRIPANPPGISNSNLMIRCQLLLDQLQRARVQSNSLLTQLDINSNGLIIRNWNFPAIRQGIQEFQKSLKKFLQVLLDAMRRWTVSTRQNEASPNEDQVVRILDVIVSESPFAAQELSRWLRNQKQQIETLESFTELPCVDHLPGSKQVLDSLIENGGDSFALVLHLPNLIGQPSDHLVQEMNRYIDAFDANSESTSWAGKGRRHQGPTVDYYRAFLKASEEFSNWVKDNNSETANVHYAIFYDERAGQTPFLRLYCCGTDDSVIINIPEAPGPVEIIENESGVITLGWTYGETDIWRGFLLQYRNVNHEPNDHYETIQQLIQTKTITIDNLPPDEIYVFRVAAETLAGRSSFGPVSNEVKISSICPPPSNIQVKCVTDSTITLAWDHYVDPRGPIRINSYSTDCWVDGGEETILIQRTTTDREVTIKPLDRDTLYHIEVRAVYMDASGSKFDGPACPVWKIRTEKETKRPAQIVRRASRRHVTGPRSEIDTYYLTLTKLPTPTPSVEHYVYGERLHSALFGKRRQRTVLMVGATGSGKTTLINAMVNYILGVEWDDNFRFKLIDESTGKSQAHSQTDLVTTYDVYHTKGSRLEYSLTVVDTPGFGDTRGIEKDQKLRSQIQNYFKCENGIHQLEAVCIVVEASLPRLTPTQKYIFDSILSIFGNDIKGNIRLMVTFADNAEPPVLAAIKEAGIPSPCDSITGLPIHHKFNNSIFFANNKQDRHTNEINRTYYDMSVESFDHFFRDLSRIEAKSLTLTREVLEERRKLQILVESLQMRAEMKLTRGNELDKMKKVLTDNAEKMEANENLEFEVEVLVSEPVDISGTGQYTTNCQKCRTTCHFPCRQVSDSHKDLCSVMDSNGNCLICVCPWNKHCHQNYRYEKVKEIKKLSLDSIRESYDQVAANNEALSNKQLLEKIQMEISDVEVQLLGLMQATSRHVQRLEEIALRPHLDSTTAYIDLMIEAEKKDMKADSRERIARLQRLRQNAEFNPSVVVERIRSPPRGQTGNTGRIDPTMEQQVERHNTRKEEDTPLENLKADVTESIEVNHQASAMPAPAVRTERPQPAPRRSLLSNLTVGFNQMKVAEEKEIKSDP